MTDSAEIKRCDVTSWLSPDYRKEGIKTRDNFQAEKIKMAILEQ